jgi:hypothetical protein
MLHRCLGKKEVVAVYPWKYNTDVLGHEKKRQCNIV